MKTYNGAEITIKILENFGIQTIAGIPGGANLPLYDALKQSSINHILVRHEQSAGFIAQGMARSTGKPAVCIATSGPGATNLITAIADAKADSIPIIAITGQVPSSLQGTDAFQEINAIEICKTITKKAYYVKSAQDLLQIIPEAFALALDGRPGPILIDIPKDVQKENINICSLPEIETKTKEQKIIPTASIEKAAEIINASERPVFYIGGGMQNKYAAKALNAFTQKTAIPIASTLMGLGICSPENDLFLGMLGMHGTFAANTALHEADTVIALGVRFDDRATGKLDAFCPKAKIVHVDIDKNEINKILNVDIGINGDACAFLEQIKPLIQEKEHCSWINHLNTFKETDLDSLQKTMKDIIDTLPEDSIITTDVGQHQMWAAQMFPFAGTKRFLTSGGLGTMGFGLPAAIGAALAHPDKAIACISGDGSILMNIQELATLQELNLNIKVFILNNNSLGLVRQQQELFYKTEYIASQYKHKHDFVKIATAFDLPALRTSDIETINDYIDTNDSQIIEIPICQEENVFPMVAPGGSNLEMIRLNNCTAGI